MLKSVRVQNATTDSISIRVYVIHPDSTIRAIFDVLPGQTVQNNRMNPGHRGVIVYDDFNGDLIATGSFVLDIRNVQLTVSGDAAGGYTLAYRLA